MRATHVTFAMTGMALAAVLLAGCSRHDTSSDTSVASVAKQEALVPPSNPNDAVAWRAFLGKAILAETRDPKLHPYAFVVPGGDSVEAVERRQGEAMAIRGMLGHTAVPGNILALTGPDSAKVIEVIGAAFKDVPAHGAQGLTIFYVGTSSTTVKAQAIVRAAGAELRARAIQVQ